MMSDVLSETISKMETYQVTRSDVYGEVNAEIETVKSGMRVLQRLLESPAIEGDQWIYEEIGGGEGRIES